MYNAYYLHRFALYFGRLPITDIDWVLPENERNFSYFAVLSSDGVLAVRRATIKGEIWKIGGPKWTRTTDLTLIRRAL